MKIMYRVSGMMFEAIPSPQSPEFGLERCLGGYGGLSLIGSFSSLITIAS